MRKRPFGRLDGRPVEEIVLESASAAVSILSFGAAVRDWRVDGEGRSLPMVLGFPSMEDYAGHSRSHGIVAGRVANRIAESQLHFEGRTYPLTPSEGRHHLHGGRVGLGRRIWEMEGDGAANAVHLRYLSPDGEEGYPGAVAFAVSYRLDGATLVCEMEGLPDRPTPVNLAQHNYYNLGGGGDVLDHVLRVAAREYTVLDAEQIPTGEILPVAGTPMDFTEARTIGEADPGRRGIDVNLVLDPGRDRAAPTAEASCARTGYRLRLWTEEPGLQVYDGAGVTIAVPGHDGARYGPFAGLCLEAQHFPDSMNHPGWPSIVRTPEAPYRQTLRVEIAR